MALFVYLCFFVGLVEVVRLPFRAYRFAKQVKNGERGFQLGRFRNDDKFRDSRSSGRGNRGDNHRSGTDRGTDDDGFIDIDGNDFKHDNNRMPDISEY